MSNIHTAQQAKLEQRCTSILSSMPLERLLYALYAATHLIVPVNFGGPDPLPVALPLMCVSFVDMTLLVTSLT